MLARGYRDLEIIEPLAHPERFGGNAEDGFDVVVPSAQVCCGAINSHVGDIETTRQLAHRNIEAFSPGMNSPIVSLSAGCGARMKKKDELLKDDPIYSQPALNLSEMVKEINENGEIDLK